MPTGLPLAVRNAVGGISVETGERTRARVVAAARTEADADAVDRLSVADGVRQGVFRIEADYPIRTAEATPLPEPPVDLTVVVPADLRLVRLDARGPRLAGRHDRRHRREGRPRRHHRHRRRRVPGPRHRRGVIITESLELLEREGSALRAEGRLGDGGSQIGVKASGNVIVHRYEVEKAGGDPTPAG